MKYIIEVSRVETEDDESLQGTKIYHQIVEDLDYKSLIKIINDIH